MNVDRGQGICRPILVGFALKFKRLLADRSALANNALAARYACSVQQGRTQMHMRAYCLAAVVVFALSGCMSPGPKMGPIGSASRVTCPANQCEEIIVTVVETGTMSEPACKVEKVSIPVASITGEPAGTKTVRWVLKDGDQSPYEFSKVDWKFAIFFKDDGADPNGVFSNATVPGNGKRLSIMFDHKTTASANGYSYGITVRRSSNGQFCSTLDPWFIG